MMKRLILILATMFGFLFSGCGANGRPQFYDGVPVLYEYSHDVCMMYPDRYYKVFTREDGTVCIGVCTGRADVTVYRAPADALEVIGELVRKHRLYKLKESYRPPFEVLDGYMWHLAIRYDGGSIWSGGANALPDSKLQQGIVAINQYLEEHIASCGEDDVLDTVDFREFRE